ncbi:MAG TPA: TIGR03089 family protein [Actinotalea sp.]
MTAASSPLPLATVLRDLTADPGRPRLTWYGPQDERIELSGHVLDNWVTKTTNLLLEEFSAGPGTRVLVDLPVHWRTVVWAFAVWRAGSSVVLPGTLDAQDCDVVVTDRPAAYAGTGTEVVAVALGALARRFDGDLPPGAMDAAGAVMTYGDVLTWVPEADNRRAALELEGRTVAHDELLAWATSTTVSDGARVLVTPDGPATLLGTALAVYAAHGSVVLCDPTVAERLTADPDRRARLVATERIDAG